MELMFNTPGFAGVRTAVPGQVQHLVLQVSEQLHLDRS